MEQKIVDKRLVNCSNGHKWYSKLEIPVCPICPQFKRKEVK